MRQFTLGSKTMHLVIVCTLALTTQLGCGETLADSADSPEKASDRAAVSAPYPSDPETLITVSTAAVDEDGSVKLTSQRQVTKGAQWKQLFGSSPGEVANAAQSDLEKTTGSIVIESCWHGSPIVLNDQPGFAGNYLCFNNSVPSKFVDLGGTSFVTRSFYSVDLVQMFDAAHVERFVSCTQNLVVKDPYTGPTIRYLATPSTRSGRCHF